MAVSIEFFLATLYKINNCCEGILLHSTQCFEIFQKKKSFITQFAHTSGIMKAKLQNQRFLKGYLNNNKSDEQTFPKILLQSLKIHIKKKVAMNYYSTEATRLYCTNNICLQITCYIIYRLVYLTNQETFILISSSLLKLLLIEGSFSSI